MLSPVGDKYVTDKLRELAGGWSEKGYGIGGEQAGHVALMDPYHTTGDGIRTGLYITRVFMESGAKSLSDLAALIKKTPQFIASAFVGRGPRLNQSALDMLQQEWCGRLPGIERINLRYSGTEPQFRAMVEANASVPERELGQALWEICRSVQAAAGTTGAPLEILDCARGGVFEPGV